jgi:hypothetical protein
LHALPEAVRHGAARSVVGGVQVAARTGDPSVAAAVREAFVSGLHTASFVAAAATLLGAVVVAVTLPARGRDHIPAAAARERTTDILVPVANNAC